MTNWVLKERIEELEALLAELENMLAMKQDDWIEACNEATRLEQELQKTQLQLMQEETDLRIWQQDCKNAEAQLCRYQGAVEVDGQVVFPDIIPNITIWLPHNTQLLGYYHNQRVRVLVMKEVE